MLTRVCMHAVGVTAPVAAESGVPGSTGGRAGLLAGQAQGDAITADSLQKARAGGWLLLTGDVLLAAETQTDEEIQADHPSVACSPLLEEGDITTKNTAVALWETD